MSCQHKQKPDMTGHLLAVQGRVTTTVHISQQHGPIVQYMNYLKSCTEHNSYEFNSWLLSIKKV